MALWTPAQISTVLWLDSSNPTSTIVGSVPPYIAEWINSGGGSAVCQQPIVDSQPELLLEQQNGLNALNFDGFNDYFSVEMAEFMASDLAGLTVFAAVADLGGGLVFYISPATNTGDPRVSLAIEPGSLVVASGKRLDGDTTQSVSSDGVAGWGQVLMARFDWEHATLDLGVNGTVTALPEPFQTPGHSDPSAAEVIGIGGVPGGWGFTGQIGEIIVVAGAVTQGLRLIIEGYLAHKWGLADSLPADHLYKLSAPEEIASGLLQVRAVLDQPWSDAPVVRGTMDQPWSILSGGARGVLDQPWAIKTGAVLDQPWGNAPVTRALLYQPWADAVPVRAVLVQRWADLLSARATLFQPWTIMADARSVLDQPWAILSHGARAELKQLWDIRNTTPARAVLHQPWSLAADGTVLRYTVVVLVDERPVRPLSITIEGDRSEDCLSCELELATEAEYLQCLAGASVVVSATSQEAAEEFVFVVTIPRITEGFGATQYFVEALSPGAMMGQPYASGVDGPLTGLASDIAGSLISGCDWSTVDGDISDGVWTASGETPLVLLRRLADALGAVVQSRRDGTMVIEAEYPVPLPQWETVLPERVFVETVDCFSVGETFEPRTGWNSFAVSDQVTSGGRITLEEAVISSSLKEYRCYEAPWKGGLFLVHSGGPWAAITDMGEEFRSVVETVEFVAGGGSTQYPVYGVSSRNWLHADLGSITYLEDGTLTSQVAGESLCLVKYTTRCRLWRVRDSRSEQLQLLVKR